MVGRCEPFVRSIPVARLFISYKRDEQAYAYAIRQYLLDQQAWASDDIFVDVGHLQAGDEWERKLLAEAEAAEVVLFIASDASLDLKSFCYRELRAARSTVLAVTIKGVTPDDERLMRALPHEATARQIAALIRQPLDAFSFTNPRDNTTGVIGLNRAQVESIGATLRDLGVAPDSFTWTYREEGPYPGLRPLREGDEALFCGRSIEIRDGLKDLEELRASILRRALLIHAPSGAGKSSFLRAGLWRRLRRHAAFTPLAIIRADKGAIRHEEWGLIAGLYDTLSRAGRLRTKLSLTRGELEDRVARDLTATLAAFADEDKGEAGRRTLLIGIDQSEEITGLSTEDDAELERILSVALKPSPDLNVRLVLTARDDSVDATLARLARSGLRPDGVLPYRLHLLPPIRYDDVILGPAKAAEKAGYPLKLNQPLVEALVAAAGSGDQCDALPILALALQRMVKMHRRTRDGRVTLEAEKASGFLEGVVAGAANVAMARANATPDDLRRLVIPRLATWDPRAGAEGAAKRLVASESTLFAGPRAGLQPLADNLVDERLLIRSGTDAGAAYEVAHEALLRVAPLGALIFERREKFEHQQMLLTEAREWVASGEATDRLARAGERLKDAEALLADEDFGDALRQEGTHVARYLAACGAAQQALIERETAQQRERQRVELEAANAKAEAQRRIAQRTLVGLAAALVLAILAATASGIAW
jgi:hypothetical protein